jgi:hypothetical protein
MSIHLESIAEGKYRLVLVWHMIFYLMQLSILLGIVCIGNSWWHHRGIVRHQGMMVH